MIHTNMPRNCVVFLLPRRRTWSAINYGSQIFDPHKWPTVLVRKAKGKPRNTEAYLCGSLYSSLKISFQPYAFCINKRSRKCFLLINSSDPRQRVPLSSYRGEPHLQLNFSYCHGLLFSPLFV